MIERNRGVQSRWVWAFALVALIASQGALADADITADLEALGRREYPTETLYQLWRASRNDPKAVVEFINRSPTRHRVEPIAGDDKHLQLTYFHLGSDAADYVMLSGGPDFFGLRFSRLGETQLFFCTQRVPKDAFFTYGFNEFTAAPGALPGAPTQHGMDHVYDGVFVGPDAPLSPALADAGSVPHGKLVEWNIDSRFLQQARKVSLYLPAGYSPTNPAA